MAREYWFDVSLKADGDENGFGSGGSVKFCYDGEWVTDEDLDADAQRYAKWIAADLKRARNIEMERDREAAKPFWMKWLGA